MISYILDMLLIGRLVIVHWNIPTSVFEKFGDTSGFILTSIVGMLENLEILLVGIFSSL